MELKCKGLACLACLACLVAQQQFTDESEIQEVNPPKTVAPPPLQLQPLNEDLHVRWRIEAYINTISLIRAILEFHSQ